MRSKIIALLILTTLMTTLWVPTSIASSNRFFDFSSGRNTVGFFTSFSDDFSYLFGQVRTKPAGAFEVGLKAGAADVDKSGLDATGAYLGIDGNFGLYHFEDSFPFDLYLTFGYAGIIKSRRSLNEFFIGPVGEKTLSSSPSLIIKGTLGVEIDWSGGSLVDDDEFDAFMTAGLTFNIGKEANILLELKGGSDLAAGIGINFDF